MPSRRPGSVTAAGVMSIIYGSLMSLCGLCGLAGLAAGGNANNEWFGGNDPAAAELQKQLQEALERDAPAFQTVQVVAAIVSLGIALCLLVAGIGVLNISGWARTLALASCLIGIANTLWHGAYQLVYEVPITSEVMDRALPALPPGGPQVEQQRRIMQIIPVVVAVVMVIVGVVLVVYLLIIVLLLRRPTARAAFANAGSADWPGADEHRWTEDENDRDWNRPPPL